MKPARPHKGVYKIRIYKTHGKRVPRSRHELRTRNSELYRVDNWPLVTDISRVAKTTTPLPEYQKSLTSNGYSPKFVNDIMVGLYHSSFYAPKPKPSLWQRIKRKVKR